ncbi:MAG: hypothetical protein R3B81_06175 [bacterium]
MNAMPSQNLPLRVIAGLILTILCALPVGAATVSWTNASGGNWSNPANWDLGVPGAADDVRIDVSGTYTVTLDVHTTVTSLTLGGASGAQTLFASGRTITVSGASVVGPNGILNLASGTLSGAGSWTNGGVATLSSTTVNTPLENQGTLIFQGSSSANGALTTGAGTTLRILGSGTTGSAVLTVANGFTNNGVVELTSTGSAQAATLNVTNGTLLNTPGRTIDVQAGSGGTRGLNAQLVNQGLLSVGAALTMTKASADHQNLGWIDVSGGNLTVSQSGTTPTFQTAGTITIAAGRTLAVSGGEWIYAGGPVTGGGTISLASLVAALQANLSNADVDLVLSSTTVNGPGWLMDAVGKTLTLTSCTVNAAMENLGTLVFQGTSSANDVLATGPGTTLRVLGSGTTGGAVLTVANGFTNNGVVELTSTGSAQTATLNVTSGALLNAPGRTIDVQVGSGGSRGLNAQLVNQGLLSVGTALTMSRASADHQNLGWIDVSGGNLTVSQSGTTPTFQTAGTITIAAGRTLAVSGGEWIYAGGPVTGGGTISLASLVATLQTNLSNADVDLVLSSTTVNGPGWLMDAAGKTLTLTSCTVNAALENLGTLVFQGTSSANDVLATGPGTTLRVLGSGTTGGAVLTVANGFTNNGIVELTSTGSAQTATLNVTSGTLVNAAGGTIDVQPGSGGARGLNAELGNQGLLSVGTALSISKTAADHASSGSIDVTGGNLTLLQGGATPTFTNSGTVTLAAGRTMVVTGGAITNDVGGILRGGGTLDVASSTFSNAGTISPGLSPAILSVTGNCPLASTSTVEIEIGGAIPGTDHDRLAVSGTASLDGVLNVSFLPGFCTTPGDSFRVLTAAVRSGTFGAVLVSGKGNAVLDAHYDATGLTLLTVSNSFAIVASAGPGGSIDPAGAIDVECGGDRDFTITPDPCHEIVDVLVDGLSVGPVGTYAFANVTEDHTISASFALIHYTIAASAGPGGSVTPAGDVDVACGTDQGFTITPAAGFQITDVIADGGSVGPVTSYTFPNVQADHTLAATFADVQPPTVAVVSPNGGEIWNATSVHTIRWTATDNAAVDSVSVDYSLNGPSGPWLVIQHGAADADSVEWTVPDVGTESALVRVTAFDAASNSAEDLSDAPFQILGPTDVPIVDRPALALSVAPNPARAGVVHFQVAFPEAGEASLEVISVSGRRVWKDRVVAPAAGRRGVDWSGRDAQGQPVGPGFYVVRLLSPWGETRARLILLR